MTRPVIAVADTAFADHAGLEKDFNDHAELRWIDLSRPDTVRESTGDADAVVVTLQRLSDDVITAFAPSVRVIGRAGVGLDTIDLTTAEKRGIAVINQPAYAAAEVATHALALLLALERRLSPADAFVRAGWRGPLDLGGVRALDDATVGVVGGGRIGQAFVERVRPLVRQVVVYDPAPVSLPPGVERAADLPDLLRRSDMLSLHLPLIPATKGLIGRDELRLLPPARSWSTSPGAGSSTKTPWPNCCTAAIWPAPGSTCSRPNRFRRHLPCSPPRTPCSPRTARRRPGVPRSGYPTGRSGTPSSTWRPVRSRTGR